MAAVMDGVGFAVNRIAVNRITGVRSYISCRQSVWPLELRRSSDVSGLTRAARALRFAAGLIVLALPLSGCGPARCGTSSWPRTTPSSMSPPDKLLQ